ncbi:unnamed protein product [Haemonchus placei]|uniref:BHLH domain-containing protein n=1 Tax=Haemonchus placei TaxID=6290 RepID=A0A0N4XBA1_HAEPC|nr:unnamed protein product [Haemonchus placei]
MQHPYPTSFHYSYTDSEGQTSTTNTPMESPAYPPPYPCSQEQYDMNQSVKREKRKYRCRKRSPATIERARMIRRDKANARERRRMNSLNDALEHLRTLLPTEPEEPKMTKIETLRVAQGYVSNPSLTNWAFGVPLLTATLQFQVKREKRKYRCRKRSPATIERARMIRRDKANARERRRMNSLNDALEHLRTLLPTEPEEPKMTKIETLRVAQGYVSNPFRNF